jgi:hypothetical protein
MIRDGDGVARPFSPSPPVIQASFGETRQSAEGATAGTAASRG